MTMRPAGVSSVRQVDGRLGRDDGGRLHPDGPGRPERAGRPGQAFLTTIPVGEHKDQALVIGRGEMAIGRSRDRGRLPGSRCPPRS